ncbi:MAG: leucyl aminopeptidase [Magnetovibrio sp.]|nr:leucyl aminopeptidase [Magnetovibrio sp.]
MKINFANPSIPNKGVVVILATEGSSLISSTTKFDKQTNQSVTRAIKGSNFKGKNEQLLTLMAPSGTNINRILLVGLGKPKTINELSMQRVGGCIYANLAKTGQAIANIIVDAVDNSDLAAEHLAAQLAYGARLRSYRFDKYRTREEASSKPSLKTLTLISPKSSRARAAFAPLDKIARGVFTTRDLVSEPPNIIYPHTFAQQAQALVKLGIKVEVLGEAQMRRLGMGALLGVGQGSVRESKLVVMRWNGAGRSKSEQPIAFVGKGVTFDTGGISLKPGAGMEDMKWDMGGAGVVVGLMMALAGRKAKVNAIGVVGLVENMPGGNAQRPGDIVTSMSGQTIEIINTDAEGRLVLADALHYTINKFNPKFVVDLATLTGAIIISLGNEYAGMFSNNDQLSERLYKAGEEVDEKVWRQPLGDAYDKLINTDSADMKNIGGRGAGSITAAQFLQRFVGKTPWAHLDIAGVTWSKKDMATVPRGGTAFGVRLLERLVANYYEFK